MNQQEMFDRVYASVVRQGCRSYDENMRICRYKDNDGNKCAVGHLLPEGHPAFQETNGILPLLGRYPDLRELWNTETIPGMSGFLSALQRAHDKCKVAGTFVEDYTDRMRGVAQMHNLSGPI